MAWLLSRRDFIGSTQKFALATPFLSLTGCIEDGADDVVSLGGRTMGTTYHVKLVEPPAGIDTELLAREIDDVLARVNQQMSTYLPTSELSRFNDAEVESWTPVSMDTLDVVEQSLRVNAVTNGAFDPTVGPIVDLWGFGPGGSHERVPSDAEIHAVSDAVGFAKVESQSGAAPMIRKHAAGVRLDFSGVAKGFGVDKVAEHLTGAGIKDYLVEVGGELRASGHGPEGRAWRVGIEKPTLTSDDVQHVVDLGNGEALATSGNYRIFFERDGQRFSHIIDPTRGRPVEHDLASVSVIANTTLEADALSTSLLVLGPEEGMALAERLDIQAYFIVGRDGSFTAKASPAFTRHRAA
ncbi:MAG: FAD:protein FMN transferase [Geminicoccaceae bacterium]